MQWQNEALQSVGNSTSIDMGGRTCTASHARTQSYSARQHSREKAVSPQPDQPHNVLHPFCCKMFAPELFTWPCKVCHFDGKYMQPSKQGRQLSCSIMTMVTATAAQHACTSNVCMQPQKQRWLHTARTATSAIHGAAADEISKHMHHCYKVSSRSIPLIVEISTPP